VLSRWGQPTLQAAHPRSPFNLAHVVGAGIGQYPVRSRAKDKGLQQGSHLGFHIPLIARTSKAVPVGGPRKWARRMIVHDTGAIHGIARAVGSGRRQIKGQQPLENHGLAAEYDFEKCRGDGGPIGTEHRRADSDEAGMGCGFMRWAEARRICLSILFFYRHPFHHALGACLLAFPLRTRPLMVAPLHPARRCDSFASPIPTPIAMVSSRCAFMEDSSRCCMADA